MRGERTSVKLWRRGKQGMFYLNIRVPKDIAEAYFEAYVRPSAEARAKAADDRAKKRGEDVAEARAKARAKFAEGRARAAETRAEARAKGRGEDIAKARADARAKAAEARTKERDKEPKVLVSLGTSDRAEALRQRDEKLPGILDQFAQLRAVAKLGHRDLSALSRADLERLAMGYYRDVLLPAAKSRSDDPEEHAERVDDWNEVLASHLRQDEAGSDAVRATTDLVLQRGGWPTERALIGAISGGEAASVDRTLPQYADLQGLVRRAAVEGSRLALAELSGRPYEPTDSLFAPGVDLAAEEAKRGPLLSEALSAWKEGSSVAGGRKPRPQTVIEAEMAVRHFTQLNGDMRIGEIGKKLVQDYAVAISKIPVKLSTELQKLTLPDLLKRDLSKLRRRSASTVNKSLQMLSAMIEQGRRRSDLDEASNWPNHFKAERVESDATAEDDRVPFSSADLRSIFVDGPVHGRGERLKGGRGEAQHWLPLLALFTGARLSELGQLRVCDVRTDDGGIAFISIGTSGGRTVKTRTSIRKVPIHPELRLMGFLGYVERRKDAAGQEATLWPLLGSAKGRAWTAAFSQWWGNYQGRKPISIADERKVFHSFRHLFKDMCRDAGLSEDVHDALTGHAAGKSVGRSYGSGHSVARLHSEISKVTVPVDLSHLHTVQVTPLP